MKVALTIAGSDSGGGAGIQADIKTFHQFGVFGTTAIVALTAQNTVGVRAVHLVPPDIVTAQLEALADDLPPDALKTGMLADATTARVVVDFLKTRAWPNLVVDPVMVASSGDRLLTREAESVIRSHLLPLAAVVTPNVDEAEILSDKPIHDVASMEQAGHVLLKRGAAAALMKGGHLVGPVVFDLLITPNTETRIFTHPRLDTRSTHGTGCTLSAAVTAGLALGHPLHEAVATAIDYVYRAMSAAPGLGGERGHGPLNHMV